MASISVIFMSVSQEEADMIEAARAEKAMQARMRAETAKLLTTASGYNLWVINSNRLITYETFCEYAGFLVSRDRYSGVCQIISEAERCAQVTAETVSEE